MKLPVVIVAESSIISSQWRIESVILLLCIFKQDILTTLIKNSSAYDCLFMEVLLYFQYNKESLSLMHGWNQTQATLHNWLWTPGAK